MKFSELKIPSNKKFGFFFTIVFILLAIYFLINSNFFYFILFIIISLLLFIVTLIFPNWLTPFNYSWMFLGYLMGKVISPIILGFIYFGLITPIGFLRRKFGNDELQMLKTYDKKNFWNSRNDKNINKESFNNQF